MGTGMGQGQHFQAQPFHLPEGRQAWIGGVWGKAVQGDPGVCMAHRGWAQQHSGEGRPVVRVGGGQGWLCGGVETWQEVASRS